MMLTPNELAAIRELVARLEVVEGYYAMTMIEHELAPYANRLLADRAALEAENERLRDASFEAVWNAIKGWDIQRESGRGYAHATGTDVEHILSALAKEATDD